MHTLLVASIGGFAGALAFTLIELVVFRILQKSGLRLFTRAGYTEEN